MAGQRLVARYAKIQLGIGFAVRLSGQAYNQLYRKLNEWRGWEMMLIGCPLTEEALNILQGGEVTERSPQFIPAFSWRDTSMKSSIYGSVIVENGQRYLELTADGGTLALLQERAACLEGIRFKPIFP